MAVTQVLVVLAAVYCAAVAASAEFGNFNGNNEPDIEYSPNSLYRGHTVVYMPPPILKDDELRFDELKLRFDEFKLVESNLNKLSSAESDSDELRLDHLNSHELKPNEFYSDERYSNEKKSNEADSNELKSDKSDSDGMDSYARSIWKGGIESNAPEWWAPICREVYVEAPSGERSWGPGDVPPADKLDVLLKSETGCRQRLVPPYDRQGFARHWAEHSGPRLQQRLAVRTVGAGRADVNLYWNGERKFYFAFSNNVNHTVELFRSSPRQLLWSLHLPPVSSSSASSSQEEHYVPLSISVDTEYIRWSAGCAGEEHSRPVSTAHGGELQLEVETSAFPAKMLYNCPLH